ncbi:hypothetical protein [Streptomyces sp. GZWMJZ-114]|uniref:hypothetical protein n=1 Tax=Streptomyces sp. GZWMJZ-114 TaxID=2494734 RepID=UPI0010104B3E|nr:hypothetical protein [Streptomyces sp. GZWMJZ-114]
MKRQRTLTACVALVAASVLVAGCGGDDEKSDKADEGKIAGTETTAPAKPSPTASEAAGEEDGPDLSLPKDVKIVTDWDEPSGAEEAAVLRDARDFTVAFYRAIAQQDSRDPAYLSYTYPGGNARRIAEKNVRDHVAKKYSVSGTERLTRPNVEIVHKGSTAVVTYCADDTHFYTKDLKAGKPMLTTPSADDHILFELGMTAVGKEERWVVKELRSDVGAQQCQ